MRHLLNLNVRGKIFIAEAEQVPPKGPSNAM
jgi:hypothetical protein